MAEDLTKTPPDRFWSRFQAMLGEGGLLTYRYLGRRTRALHDVDHDSMKLRRDMRNAAGGLAAAPLAIASAEAGGRTDRDSVPAPVTYALRILDDGRDVRGILVRPSVVHLGRTLGFSQSELVDAAKPERVIALSWGSGVKLADAPPGFAPIDPGPEIEDSPELPPLHEVFEARRRALGEWELPALNPRIASTSGTLHLGPMHVAFEAAAVELAAARAGTDRLQAEDWNVLFVAPGRAGPFLVSGSVVSGRLGRIACQLSLRDAGNGERLVARCFAVFRPAETA
jgi:acyl-coenzyme A thioesterase PaaI-like protein